jgi:hypothetical protein
MRSKKTSFMLPIFLLDKYKVTILATVVMLLPFFLFCFFYYCYGRCASTIHLSSEKKGGTHCILAATFIYNPHSCDNSAILWRHTPFYYYVIILLIPMVVCAYNVCNVYFLAHSVFTFSLHLLGNQASQATLSSLHNRDWLVSITIATGLPILWQCCTYEYYK